MQVAFWETGGKAVRDKYSCGHQNEIVFLGTMVPPAHTEIDIETYYKHKTSTRSNLPKSKLLETDNC